MAHPLLRLSFILILTLTCSAAIILVRSSTITFPDDDVRYQNGLFCTRTKWTTIASFFLGNYIAHVATVKSSPGESLTATVLKCVASLGFPCCGVANGLDAIFRCARIRGRGSALRTAAHAGALCMLVRSGDWRPVGEEETISGVILPSPLQEGAVQSVDLPLEKSDHEDARLLDDFPVLHSSTDSHGWDSVEEKGLDNLSVSDGKSRRYSNIKVYNVPCSLDLSRIWGRNLVDFGETAGERTIHGSVVDLPAGYKWTSVPRHARVDGIFGGDTEISSSYSFLKAIVSLAQTVYAIATLYRARGDQIDQYGYAAFGLTVAPYAVMSFLNLLGSLVTPDYPTLYMVQSEIMEEAKGRGGRFEGVVGTLCPSSDPFNGPQQHTGVLSGADSALYSFESISSSVPSTAQPPTTEKDDPFSSQDLIYVPTHPNFERTDSRSQAITVGMCNIPGDDNSGGDSGVNFIICTTISCIPLAIVGGLSGFQPHRSTMAERVWTMLWLTIGTYPAFLFTMMILGLASGDISSGGTISRWLKRTGQVAAWVWTLACLIAPVVGGFVVVGKMLKAFGDCIRID